MMATREEMVTALRAAHDAKDELSAHRIAGMIQQYDQAQPTSRAGIVGQALDDAARISADTMTRGYLDKILGEEDQAKTAQSRERTSDWVEAPLDVASAVATSPFRVGSMVGGGLWGAAEGAASAYGHQQGWMPEWGNIAGEAGQGALLGSGAAKVGEWLGKGWSRMRGTRVPDPTPPRPPSPTRTQMAEKLAQVGKIPREVTAPADMLLGMAHLPPIATTGSIAAKKLAPLIKPAEPTLGAGPRMIADPKAVDAMRDMLAKIAITQGKG